jgi:hypothetical protein
MIIQIQIRNVYGEDKAYPINHEAQCIARIAGTKTMTRSTLMNVLAMGCTVQELDRHGSVSRSFSGGEISNLPRVA